MEHAWTRLSPSLRNPFSTTAHRLAPSSSTRRKCNTCPEYPRHLQREASLTAHLRTNSHIVSEHDAQSFTSWKTGLWVYLSPEPWGPAGAQLCSEAVTSLLHPKPHPCSKSPVVWWPLSLWCVVTRYSKMSLSAWRSIPGGLELTTVEWVLYKRISGLKAYNVLPVLWKVNWGICCAQRQLHLAVPEVSQSSMNGEKPHLTLNLPQD